MADIEGQNHSEQAQKEVVLKRQFLHISDLHFGRVDEDVLGAFHHYLVHSKTTIDHILISGDLTQRARPWQFLKAAEFIKNLATPVIAIPGNHDVPLYHVLHRFFRPYKNYDKYIAPVVADFYEDDQILICGFRSINIYKIASGKFHDKEVDRISKALAEAKSKFKIVICHHPMFDRLSSNPTIAKMQSSILDTQPNLILTGHRHETSVRYFDPALNQSPLLVNGGTSFSNRTRFDENAFNLISVVDAKIEVTTLSYDRKQRQFLPSEVFRT